MAFTAYFAKRRWIGIEALRVGEGLNEIRLHSIAKRRRQNAIAYGCKRVSRLRLSEIVTKNKLLVMCFRVQKSTSACEENIFAVPVDFPMVSYGSLWFSMVLNKNIENNIRIPRPR